MPNWTAYKKYGRVLRFKLEDSLMKDTPSVCENEHKELKLARCRGKNVAYCPVCGTMYIPVGGE